MDTKVSIIVPVYCCEQYIRQCAESLFCQTLKELEVIFIDDCSPDRSIEVLKDTILAYPEREGQINIISLEKNGGPDNARRVGCHQSHGDFIMFVDSDDTIEKDMASKLYTAAIEQNADLVCCRRRAFYDDGRSEEVKLHDKVNDREEYLGKMICMMTADASPNITNKLFSRQLLQKIKLTPVGSIAEDWVVCVQTAHLADCIVSIDEELYNYRIRTDSLSHQSTKEGALRSCAADMANIDLIISYLESEGLAMRFKDEIQARKYVAKGSVAWLIDDKEMYRKWKSIYKEVNFGILFNPYMDSYRKKVYILRLLRIEKEYRQLISKVKSLFKAS